MPILVGPIITRNFSNLVFWPRGFFVAMLMVIPMALTITALATDISRIHYIVPRPGGIVNSYDGKFGVWRTCNTVNDVTTCKDSTDDVCDDFQHKIKTAEAFYLLSLASIVAVIIFACLNAVAITASIITAFLLWVTVVFMAVAFGLGFAIHYQSQCGNPSFHDAGFAIGPSVLLLVIGWGFALLCLLLNCCLEPGPHDLLAPNGAFYGFCPGVGPTPYSGERLPVVVRDAPDQPAVVAPPIAPQYQGYGSQREALALAPAQAQQLPAAQQLPLTQPQPQRPSQSAPRT